MVEAAIAEQRQAWDAAQVMVMYFPSRVRSTMRFSPSRLRQILFQVLELTRSCSPPGSVVHVKLQGGARKARLIIQHPSRPQAEPATQKIGDGAARIPALIDSVVTGAGGKFSFSRSPLSIVMEFSLKTKVTKQARDTAV
jgi:hypothetical protein